MNIFLIEENEHNLVMATLESVTSCYTTAKQDDLANYSSDSLVSVLGKLME